MKILVNALSGNGDALMFSPALRLLKENLPDSRVDMLVMFKSVAEMYYNNPFVDRIYYIDFLNQSKLRSLAELRVLRKNNYHYSINIYPSNRFEYNFLNYLIGAEKRLSHHYDHTHYFRCEFFNTELIDEVKDEHNVIQNVKLVEKITDIKREANKGYSEYQAMVEGIDDPTVFYVTPDEFQGVYTGEKIPGNVLARLIRKKYGESYREQELALQDLQRA